MHERVYSARHPEIVKTVTLSQQKKMTAEVAELISQLGLDLTPAPAKAPVRERPARRS